MKTNLPDLKNRKILITGGMGFIGSNLALRCLELGALVTVYDCLDPRSGGNMYNIAPIKDSIRVVLNDIRNFEGISDAILNKDILFNCAAYTSHPNSMKEPLADIDVNCKGTINILEAARRFNPGIKIVHVGSSTQIGKAEYAPIDEKHPEFPLDIYSANKSASEKYVLVYGNAYRIPVTVIRFTNVFGPRSNIKSSDMGFINYFIGLAFQGRDLTVFGEGKQLRNVVYVEDCVSALILASLSEKSNGEVFLAAAGEQYSVIEIARLIVEAIGKGRVRSIEWPTERKAIEIGDALINNCKIKGLLDWEPRYNIRTGLSETKKYFETCLKYYL